MPRRYRWKFSQRRPYGTIKDRAQYSPNKPDSPTRPDDKPVVPKKRKKRRTKKKPKGWEWYNPRFFNRPSNSGRTASKFVATYAYLRWLELLKL